MAGGADGDMISWVSAVSRAVWDLGEDIRYARAHTQLHKMAANTVGQKTNVAQHSLVTRRTNVQVTL